MAKERTLDEALDEFDRWEQKVARRIENLSSEQVVEYFKGAQARLQKRTGKRLKLPMRAAPQTMDS